MKKTIIIITLLTLTLSCNDNAMEVKSDYKDRLFWHHVEKVEHHQDKVLEYSVSGDREKINLHLDSMNYSAYLMEQIVRGEIQ